MHLRSGGALAAVVLWCSAVASGSDNTVVPIGKLHPTLEVGVSPFQAFTVHLRGLLPPP